MVAREVREATEARTSLLRSRYGRCCSNAVFALAAKCLFTPISFSRSFTSAFDPLQRLRTYTSMIGTKSWRGSPAFTSIPAAAIACRRVLIPAARSYCAAPKVTTNLVGLDVVPNAPEVLTEMYNKAPPNPGCLGLRVAL